MSVYKKLIFDYKYDQIVKDINNWLLSIVFDKIMMNLDSIIKSVFIGYKLPNELIYRDLMVDKCRFVTCTTATIAINAVLGLDKYGILEKSQFLDKIHVVNCRVDSFQHCFLVVDGYVLDLTFCQFRDDLSNILITEEEKFLNFPFISSIEKHNAIHWILLDSNIKLDNIFDVSKAI